MTEEERDLMGNLTAIICEKYQVAGTYAPEFLLGLALVGYGVRTHAMFRKLDAIEEAAGDRGRKSEPMAAAA